MPHLNELYEQYKDEGLVVLGVCTSSGQENYASVVEQTKMAYPVARDPDQKTAKGGEWVIMWFPTYVLVDRTGTVRASGLFGNDGIDSIIRTLLAEEPAQNDEATEDAGDGDGGDADAPEDAAPFVEAPAEVFENPNETKLAHVGKQAPALHATEWMNTDEALTLEGLRGKVVLLDYWATW